MTDRVPSWELMEAIVRLAFAGAETLEARGGPHLWLRPYEPGDASWTAEGRLWTRVRVQPSDVVVTRGRQVLYRLMRRTACGRNDVELAVLVATRLLEILETDHHERRQR